MPDVTVLMAVYNGDRFVGQAVESILAQTFRDFELLIIDDGSTDRTREVIGAYDDPRIRLVCNDRNLGLTATLNRGLDLAHGDLVARQDADDLSAPTRLAKQVAAFDARPELALLGTWYRKIDEDGRLIGERELPCGQTAIRWALLFYCPFVHSAVMLRRSAVLGRVGRYDESFVYSQDYELWSRIAARLAVDNLGEQLVSYRVSGSSMTATYGDRVLEGPSISAANVAPLLAWSDADLPARLAAHQAMHAVLYGSHERLSAEQANDATRNVLRLLTAFCTESALSLDDCAALHAEVRGRLRWRLFETAGRYSDAEYAEARRLLAGETPLHWLHLFRAQRMRQSFSQLGGTRLVAAVRHRLTREPRRGAPPPT